jgi:hypothetical protein
VILSLRQSGLSDWREIAEAQRLVEGWRGLLALKAGRLAPQAFYAGAAQTYMRSMQGLFEALSASVAVPVFVDSSKSTRLTLSRALALEQLCRFDVRFIHLVRDGRAVMWSGAKGSNKQLAAGQPPVSSLRGYKTAASWNATNLLTALLSRQFKKRQTVYYEDFAASPDKTVSVLADQLQLDLAQLRHKLMSGQALRAEHLIAGNRVVQKQAISLQPDYNWQDKLSAIDLIVFWLLAWPAMLLLDKKHWDGQTTGVPAANVEQ